MATATHRALTNADVKRIVGDVPHMMLAQAEDGFAFFLVDKLLKPGGWLLLDDLEGSYSRSPVLRDSPTS